MAYRHLFFDKKIPRFNLGEGKIPLEYYGRIYVNARNLEDFFKLYDSKKDLYVPCGNCASKKYSMLIKVKDMNN